MNCHLTVETIRNSTKGEDRYVQENGQQLDRKARRSLC